MHLEKGLVVQSCSAAKKQVLGQSRTLPLKELGWGRTEIVIDISVIEKEKPFEQLVFLSHVL